MLSLQIAISDKASNLFRSNIKREFYNDFKMFTVLCFYFPDITGSEIRSFYTLVGRRNTAR